MRRCLIRIDSCRARQNHEKRSQPATADFLGKWVIEKIEKQ